MRQILKEPELQFEKLWQIFDHCIKTHKYKQIANKFFDSENGRCASGVIFSYASDKRPKDMNKSILNGEMWKIVMEKYGVGRKDINYSKVLYNNCVTQNLVDDLRGYYIRTGIINSNEIQFLNDIGFTFEQFRDLFKEMNV